MKPVHALLTILGAFTLGLWSGIALTQHLYELRLTEERRAFDMLRAQLDIPCETIITQASRGGKR